MENCKTPYEVRFDLISQTLNLPENRGFHHLYVRGGDRLSRGVLDRTLILHDVIILWLCRKGSCTIRIDNTDYPLSQGEMFFVFTGVKCHITDISEDFEADTLLGRISHSNRSRNLTESIPTARQLPILSLTTGENQALTALMYYIDASVSNWSRSNRKEQDNTILTLLRGELMEMYLTRDYATKEPTESEKLVGRFLQMLSSGTIAHRDVEWYASEFGLSPKRFAMKVKRVSGKSPSDHIAEAVINNAQRLLLNTNLSSSEISERLNFVTPSFFCRYFKRYAGVSPQEWRAKNKIQ